MRLLINQYGTEVRKRGELLVLRTADKETEVKLPHLDCVVMGSGIGISSDAITALMDRGIPTHFISRGGRYRGTLAAPKLDRAARRKGQILASESPGIRLTIASRIVGLKIRRQQQFLRDVAKRRGHACPTLPDNIEEAGSIEALLAAEGQAAKAYWAAYAKFVPEQFGFTGRRKRPAGDAANSVLNYLYAFLGAECADAALMAGLDPAFGFLHADRPGRMGLALDLMEQFRVEVDRVVLRTLSLGMLTPSDFSQADGGVRLSERARGVVAQEFWARLGAGEGRSVRSEIWDEAERLAIHLLGLGGTIRLAEKAA
jgi:CRISPR-associated protein Cas1